MHTVTRHVATTAPALSSVLAMRVCMHGPPAHLVKRECYQAHMRAL